MGGPFSEVSFRQGQVRPSLYEIFRADGSFYLVMEHIPRTIAPEAHRQSRTDINAPFADVLPKHGRYRGRYPRGWMGMARLQAGKFSSSAKQ